MRIVSGIYGGRKLIVPKGRAVRPTSDKIRGAVFNILRSRGLVEGAYVIDGFCGTGALGLEALSQGAAFCVFIDTHAALCQENIEALGVQDCKVIPKDITKIGARPEGVAAAELVFLDPPYGKGLIEKALKALVSGGWLAAEAVCVLEAEKNWRTELPENFEILDERLYGETKIVLVAYQPSAPE